MWSRCSPNSIHRLACSAGGRFPVASTALHRMISIDAVVAVCSASKRVALTVVYLFCLTALMITGTVCCRCFTADTTSCLLAVRLFADCCPPASDWMVHVFVCCHLWSVCVPCRTSSAWLTVACVTDYLTSSFLVQQFQWVIKWDCHWAKSPAVIFLWRSQRLLSAHRTACVTVWGPNGCSLPVCSNVCLRLVWNLLSHARLFFSLFLTPMFVLLQDSVPMASPAFLLSLFVSIQGLPPISPDPGNAPYTLVSTQPHMRDIL